jgi:hypothetical protein
VQLLVHLAKIYFDLAGGEDHMLKHFVQEKLFYLSTLAKKLLYIILNISVYINRVRDAISIWFIPTNAEIPLPKFWNRMIGGKIA